MTMWHWAQISKIHFPQEAVTVMRADRDAPGGDELATEAPMRHPELEALDALEAPIRKVPKEGDASGRRLCDRSGRRFFRRIERDKESMGIIGLGAEITPFLAILLALKEKISLSGGHV
ncbi:hypothetical protein N431DRAFT_441468 [Stipitochalara longipes BDJ]|nr:hypothetical protein N431DRAFT_441468 [Stipitochalara longipes BDJ]